MDKMAAKCSECTAVLNNKPVDVKFGFRFNDFNEIFFIMTDIRWFDKLFKKKYDGIAIDIITKNMYPCGEKNKSANSNIYKGKLLPPVYLKEMKENSVIAEKGEIVCKVGKLPSKYLDTEFELNLLILKNNYVCYYSSFYDIPSFRWEILEMGFYMDTLKAGDLFNEIDSASREKVVLFDKKLSFVIPFEKNKAEYSPEDIKPVYNSLNLTSYNITKIKIRAYSSIEGNTERNIILQNKRAQSIVDALQSYQTKNIQTEVSASENWVEFLNDISGTEFSPLADMSKEQIKERLKDKNFASRMEPILKNHRKAILVLDLQKKSIYTESDAVVIKEYFEESLKEKNIAKALEIQSVIFSKIRNNELPENFLNSIEIPEKIEYGRLLKNYAAFNYERHEEDVYSALVEFKKLEDLMPNDKHIKYNVCLLQIKSWLYGELIIEQTELLNNIKTLERIRINRKLVKRLSINY
ncbi:hypothetical protein JYU16_01770, partial [bacterium AH-315-M05]|nr:hypothetical protein [bacterium AH-315-M05]